MYNIKVLTAEFRDFISQACLKKEKKNFLLKVQVRAPRIAQSKNIIHIAIHCGKQVPLSKQDTKLFQKLLTS